MTAHTAVFLGDVRPIALALAALVTALAGALAFQLLRGPKRDVVTERPPSGDAQAAIGEALRSEGDIDELLPAILQAAAAATGARGGRLLRAGTEIVRTGKATEGTPLGVDLDAGEGDRMRLLLYPSPSGFAAEASELLHWLTVQAGVALESARLHGAEQRRALTDELTGLANRRRLLSAIETEIRTAKRGRGPALVVADLDGLAALNEQHGRAAGDELLRAFADSLWHHLRPSDLAARIGEDEFAVLLTGSDAARAGELAQRLCAELGATPVMLAKGVEVTASAGFGVAMHRRGEGAAALLAAGESALARAKAAGPGRVEVPARRRRGLSV
jgi:diguanylate cyclase (GGDEF)-like protein